MLGIWQGAIFRYPGNFALPDEFIPERWLGEDPRFAGDKNKAFEPFSYGSRNCIGKKYAPLLLSPTILSTSPAPQLLLYSVWRLS